MSPPSGCSKAVKEGFSRPWLGVALTVSVRLGVGVSCLPPSWKENPGQKAKAVYAQVVPGAGRAEVALGWVKGRLKVWCAVHAFSPRWQVINFWLLNPKQDSDIHTVPSLIVSFSDEYDLHIRTTASSTWGRLLVGFFLMCWVGWGKCSLTPSRVSAQLWDAVLPGDILGMHTGKPSTCGRCRGSECCYLLSLGFAWEISGRRGNKRQKIAFKNSSCSVLIYLWHVKSEKWRLNCWGASIRGYNLSFHQGEQC